jgi:hypothetical protein
MAILIDDFIINEVEINSKDPDKDKDKDTNKSDDDTTSDDSSTEDDQNPEEDEFSVEDDDTSSDDTDQNTDDSDDTNNSDDNQADDPEKDEFSIDNSETPDDSAGDTGDETGDEGGDSSGDNTGGDTGDDGSTDDEFSVDDDSSSDDSSDDWSGDDDTSDDDSSDTDDGTNTIQNGLSATEKEIFDNLSPEQQVIKVGELKGLFSTLYYSIDDIYNKLTKIDNLKPDSSKIVSRLSNTLDELKIYIEDYLTKTFDTKSYTENMVIYQKYLVIFNSVNKVLEKINIDINKEIDS